MKKRIMSQDKKCHKSLKYQKNIIISLKTQLEDAKMIEEAVSIQLKKKEANIWGH